MRDESWLHTFPKLLTYYKLLHKGSQPPGPEITTGSWSIWHRPAQKESKVLVTSTLRLYC